MHKLSKKYFLLLLVFTSIFTRVSFAENMQRRWAFTFYGGFSFSSNQSNGAGVAEGSTGLSFGFGGEAKLLNQISLCLDIINVAKGYNTIGSTVTSYDLTYLELPFTLKYMPSPSVAFRAGPYLGAFLLSATRESQGTSNALKGNFKNDYGVTFGTWFGFNPSQSMSVGLDIRYDMGLANILNDADPSHNVKTRSIITMGTVTFSLK